MVLNIQLEILRIGGSHLVLLRSYRAFLAVQIDVSHLVEDSSVRGIAVGVSSRLTDIAFTLQHYFHQSHEVGTPPCRNSF